MSDNEKRTLPPFDGLPLSSEDMYTHLPYVKDITLCTPETIRLVSGNVIKYYTVDTKETITIDTNAESDRLTQKSHDEVARKYAESLNEHSEALLDMTEAVEDVASKLVEDSSPDIMEQQVENEPVSEEVPQEASSEEEPEIVDAFAGYNEDEEDEYDFSFLK